MTGSDRTTLPLPALLLGAIVVLGAAIYLPAASSPPMPEEADRLVGLAAGTPAESIVFKESPDEFRPISNLLRYALLAMGGEAVSIRVTAALLHGLSALILFLLARSILARGRTGDDPPATLLAPAVCAILFAVHPLCSEALLAHGAFPFVLATLLALISLLLSSQMATEEGAAPRPFAAATLYLAALLSDASIWPMAFPAAAMAGLGAGSGGGKRLPYWRRLAPFALTLALFYVCWSMRGWPAVTPLPVKRPWALAAGIASQSAAFVSELRLLVLPWGLTVDHGAAIFAGVWNAQAVAGAAALGALLVGGVLFGLRRSLASLAFGWFAFLHLHPLVTPPEEPLSERRLYPLVAALALAGAAATRGLEVRGARRVALAAAALAAIALALLTFHRIELWKDPAALWESAAQENAVSPRPHVALGNLALERGDLDLALQSFESALARAPRSASIQHSIAEIYFRKGDYQRALQEVDKAMNLDPAYFPAYITAGNSFMMRHQIRDAFLAFNAALRLRPEDPSALFNMGALLFDQNRFAKAAQLLQMAAERRPHDAETLFRLGMARVNTGEFAQAAEALRGCLAEAPDRVDARVNLGSVLTQMKHFEEAGQILQSVLDADPGSSKAINGLAVLATAQDQPQRARDLFEKAEALDPNDLRVLFNLAEIYEKLGERAKAVDAYTEFLSKWKGSLETSEQARTRLTALQAGTKASR